jgi:L-amino acid N-acyltransferase YncA
MTTRVLHPDEWARLDGSELARALPRLPGARVIVCEDEGRVLGHLALVPMWHVEGAEIDEAQRGRGVLQALIAGMHAEARALGVSTVFPAAASDGMVHLIQRIGGVEIPARWFALAVRES